MFDVPELSPPVPLVPGVPLVWFLACLWCFLCVRSPCHRPWVLLSPPCPLPWPWGCFSVNCLETGKTENESESKEILKSLEGRVLSLIFTKLLLCGSTSCAPAGRWMRSSSLWLWRDVADSPTQSSLIKLFLKGFRNNELRGKRCWAGWLGKGWERL